MAPGPIATAAAGAIVGQAVGDLAKKASPTLPHDGDLWKLLGDAQRHLLEHFETVSPRRDDLDLGHNETGRDQVDASKTLRMSDTFTAANGVPKVFQLIARPGFVAHLAGLRVFPLNPAQSMAAVDVKVEVRGRVVQRVPELDYARPLTMDRDDVLVLVVTNTSGGDLQLGYALKGWLRANKKV